MRCIGKERTTLYFIAILVAIADSFELNSDFSVVPISIVFIMIIIFLGNKVLKELNFWQKLGLILLHASVIFLAVAFLNFTTIVILEHITDGWVKGIVKFVLLIITLMVVFKVLNNLSLKISDGKFAASYKNRK